jgi:hypothetical protein
MTLEDHVAQCELRYQALSHRLDTLEYKVDEVKAVVDGFKNTIIDFAIRGSIGLILLMAGAIFVIKL